MAPRDSYLKTKKQLMDVLHPCQMSMAIFVINGTHAV